jgi:hypothetical protein
VKLGYDQILGRWEERSTFALTINLGSAVRILLRVVACKNGSSHRTNLPAPLHRSRLTSRIFQAVSADHVTETETIPMGKGAGGLSDHHVELAEALYLPILLRG